MSFFIIIISIILIILLFVFSKIKIEIINFKFSSQIKRHINEDYKIIIKLYILSKLPIFKLNITKSKLEKLKIKEKIKKIDIKLIKNNKDFDKKTIKAIKKANIAIKKINLNIEIGTENASITSIIVPVIATVITMILRKKVKNFEDQIFIINPVFINQNLINILISGIFEFKMKHIINIIYMLSKKEKKEVKKYERTSDRRPYGYGYE